MLLKIGEIGNAQGGRFWKIKLKTLTKTLELL